MSFGATKKRTFRQFGGRENQQENIRANTLVTDQLVFQRNLSGNYRVDGSFVVDGDFIVERSDTAGAGTTTATSFKTRFSGEHVDIDENTPLYLPGTTIFRPPEYAGNHVLRMVSLQDAAATELQLLDSSAYMSQLPPRGATLSVVSAGNTQLHLRSLLARCENVLADATGACARVAASASESVAGIVFRDNIAPSNSVSVGYDGTKARSCLLFDVSGTNPMSVFRVRALFGGSGGDGGDGGDGGESRVFDDARAGALNVRRRASVFATGPTDPDAELFFVDLDDAATTSRVVLTKNSGATLHLHAATRGAAALSMDAEGKVRFGRVPAGGVAIPGAPGSVFGPASTPLETLRSAVVRPLAALTSPTTPAANILLLPTAATAMVFPEPVFANAMRYEHGMKIVRFSTENDAQEEVATVVASAQDAFFDGNENEFGVNIFEITLHAKPLNVCVDVTPPGASAKRYVVGRMYNKNNDARLADEPFDDLVFCVVRTDPTAPSQLVLENGNESVLGIVPRNVGQDVAVYSDLDIRRERSLVLVRPLKAAGNTDADADADTQGTLFINAGLVAGRTSAARAVMPSDTNTRLFRGGRTPWRAAYRKIAFSQTHPWNFVTLERLSSRNAGEDEVVARLFSLTASTTPPKFRMEGETSILVPSYVAATDAVVSGGPPDDAKMFESVLFQGNIVVATWPDALFTRVEIEIDASGQTATTSLRMIATTGLQPAATTWMPVRCGAHTSLFWDREWKAASSSFPVFRWATTTGLRSAVTTTHAESVDVSRVDADGTLQELAAAASGGLVLDKAIPLTEMDDTLYLRRASSGAWFCVHNLGRALEFDARLRTTSGVPSSSSSSARSAWPAAGLLAHSDLQVGRDAVILGGGRTSTAEAVPLALRTVDDACSVEIGNAREVQVNTAKKEVVVAETADRLAVRAPRTEFTDPARRGSGAAISHDVARVSRILSTDNVRADARSAVIVGGNDVAAPAPQGGTAIFLGTLATDVVVVGATFESKDNDVVAAASSSSSVSLAAVAATAQAVFTPAETRLANVAVSGSFVSHEACEVHVKGALRAEKATTFAAGATMVNEAGYIVQWFPTTP